MPRAVDELSRDDPGGMAIRLTQPAEPLRHLISGYFVSDNHGQPPIVDYSVPEWASIRIVCRGDLTITTASGEDALMDSCFVQGPTSRSFRFSMGDCRLLGIGLYPAALARFWGIDVSKLANDVFPIAALMGPEGAAFSGAIRALGDPDAMFAFADRHFLALLDTTQNTHPVQLTLQLHQLINDSNVTRIEDIAAAMKLSLSAVNSLCKRRFGFPPKQLLRRQRFLRMLEELHARPYSEWRDFVDPQYSDQSHMIRDFKQIMGLSPSQYLAMPRAIQKASAAIRTKTMGRALQGLD
jgi:AraC-like DNA-binding protein